MSAIDPATGLPVTDGRGLLPPNSEPPAGEGIVRLRVQARSGAEVVVNTENTASIVFDENDPVRTNVWANLIDRSPPQSQVNGLADVQGDSVFAVSWSGGDLGTGVSSYDVFVSANGAQFIPWMARSPLLNAVFAGHTGTTYSFYSVATDGAGNREAPPATPDATTQVPQLGVEQQPPRLSLEGAFPNPASGRLAVHLSLPDAAPARLELLDIAGRRVESRLLVGLGVGRHMVLLGQKRALRPGVYLIRLVRGNESFVRRVVLLD